MPEWMATRLRRALAGSLGLFSSLPRSSSTSAARSSVPLVAVAPRTDLILLLMVN